MATSWNWLLLSSCLLVLSPLNSVQASAGTNPSTEAGHRSQTQVQSVPLAQLALPTLIASDDSSLPEDVIVLDPTDDPKLVKTQSDEDLQPPPEAPYPGSEEKPPAAKKKDEAAQESSVGNVEPTTNELKDDEPQASDIANTVVNPEATDEAAAQEPGIADSELATGAPHDDKPQDEKPQSDGPLDSDIANTPVAPDSEESATPESPFDPAVVEKGASTPSAGPPTDQEVSIAEDGKEVRRVPHPLAEQGLRRITKEGVYLYDYELEPHPQQRGVLRSVRVGLLASPKISNPAYPNVTFSSVYGETPKPLILADFGSTLSSGVLGQLVWQWGLGIYAVNGAGRFANSPTNSALESYAFFVFPLNISLVYRFNFFKNQYLIPFVEGGGDLMAFAETRDDGKSTKFGGAPAAHASAGLLISLSQSTAKTLQLQRDYGIRRMWLMLEGRIYAALSEKYEFTSSSAGLGLAVDY